MSASTPAPPGAAAASGANPASPAGAETGPAGDRDPGSGRRPPAPVLLVGVTAALAVPLAGLQARFGAKGFTIGAMVMMFLGNPFAGIATGAAWLPAGVALLGGWLSAASANGRSAPCGGGPAPG